MDLGNAAELVTVGSQIVKLGGELDLARKELMAAQLRVGAIEDQLRPLVTRHAELIQSALPASLLSLPPVAAPAYLPPPAQPTPGGGPVLPASVANELSMAPKGSPAALPASQALKNRVKDFLKTRVKDDTISAFDVAEALHIDSVVVREAMLEMKHGR